MNKWQAPILTGCLLAMAALFLTTGGAAQAASMNPFGNDPVDVEGGTFDYVKEQNAVVIRGYATLTMGGTVIKGRNMVYFRDTKEIYAEGHVQMQEPGGSMFYCETLYYNLLEFRGEATNVRVVGNNPIPLEEQEEDGEDGKSEGDRLLGTEKVEPSWRQASAFNRGFITARKIRSNGRDHQEFFDPAITTDNSPRPIFRIGSAAAHLRRREKVESWNNVLYIGRMPVFYFPYIIKDLRYDWPWMRLAVGTNNDWGAYAMSSWGWDLDPDNEDFFRLDKLFWDVDWRQDRGWGFGLNAKYEIGHRRSSGHLGGYYTRETSISGPEDRDRALDDTVNGDLYADDDRWRISWDHYQKLPGEWDFRADLDAYSDRDFQKEYFNRDYNEGKEPEAIFDLRKLNEKYILEFVARPRVNDYQTQAEYLPEMRFTLPGLRLGESDFYVRNDTRIGVVNRRMDKDLTRTELQNNYNLDEGSDYGAFFRAHTDLRVYRPFSIGKVLTFTPYIGGMATYYEDVFDDSAGNTRAAGLWGAELTGRFYGTWADGKIRHIVEPSISYTANEDPTIEPDELWEVDELDVYNELHYFTIALHQKWQTKRNGRTVDYLDMDLSTKYYPYEDEANREVDGQRWDTLDLDLIWRPGDNVVFYGNAAFDMEESELITANAGLEWRWRDILRTSLSHYYRGGDTVRNPGIDESSYSTMAVRWLASDKYTLEYAISYQWAKSTADIDSGLNRQRLSIIRNLKVFEMAINVVRDSHRDDTSVHLTLSPLGIDPMERAAIRDDVANRLNSGRYGPTMVAEEEALQAEPMDPEMIESVVIP